MKKVIYTILTLSLVLLAGACRAAGVPKAERYALNDEFAESGLAQFQQPEKGEKIVVIETSMGTVKARLFPQYAPLAVENFTTHADNKYYDGTIFHRVINQYMIQGGDPLGTGYGGESIFGEPFGLEVTQDLAHIRGALCMAKGKADISIGSQFYIVSNNDLDKFYLNDGSGRGREEIQYYLDNINMLIDTDENGKEWFIKDFLHEALLKSYLKNGGAYHLDQSFTIFGQIFEGMNVVDAIQQVETIQDEVPEKDRPLTDVKIISIRTEIYK